MKLNSNEKICRTDKDRVYHLNSKLIIQVKEKPQRPEDWWSIYIKIACFRLKYSKLELDNDFLLPSYHDQVILDYLINTLIPTKEFKRHPEVDKILKMPYGEIVASKGFSLIERWEGRFLKYQVTNYKILSKDFNVPVGVVYMKALSLNGLGY